MPVVSNVRQTKISVANSRFSSGTTNSSNIGRSSRGGPGSMISHLGVGAACPPASRSQLPAPIFIANPGAVPVAFRKTSAPSGTKVSTLVFAGRGRFRFAKNFSMCASTSLFSINFLPSISAMSSRVMSSDVGPRPPVVMTRSVRPSASRTACWISLPVSATATCRVTTWPRSASRRQSHC